MTIAQIPEILLLLLVALIGYFLRSLINTIRNEIKDNQTNIQNHIIECNKIPKILILEKIDNLCDKFDGFRDLGHAFEQDTRNHLKDLNQNYNRLNNLVTTLVDQKVNH